MAYKVVKQKHFSSKKIIFRIVNTGGSQVFGVNKNFNTEKQARDYMDKGMHNRRF